MERSTTVVNGVLPVEELLRRHSGDLEAAEAGYRAAIAENAELTEAFFGLSAVLKRRGKRKEATAALNRALVLRTAALSSAAGERFVTLQEKANALAPMVSLGRTVDQFERVGRMQFNTLIRNGLYPMHKVLELGCGALNAGYFAIHFLDAGRYFGIEPNRSLVRLGLDFFLEPDLVTTKSPRFDFGDASDFSVFGERFDFVLARGLWTRANKDQIKDQIRAVLNGFAEHATDQGVFLASYWTAAVRLRDAETGKLMRPDPSLEWIRDECLERDLVVWELNDELAPGRGQLWLRIQRQA